MKNFTQPKNGGYYRYLNFFRKTTILIFSIAACSYHLTAQTQLEMSSASYPSPPNGPTVASQTATLLENTTGSAFVAYSPAITYTLSFSNQQYTSVTGISTGTGLSFGVLLSTSSKNATAASVVNTLGSIGTGVNVNQTANPNGTAGTGIDVNVNYGMHLFATAEPLYAASAALNGRYYYGDLILTFNRPVSDPVLQIVGLGGTFAASGKSQGFTMEYELQTTGVTLSKLSGSNYFNVTANKILNANTGAIDATCSSGGACGSVKVAGTNITSLTFKLYLRGDGLGTAWSNANTFSGDASTFSVTMNKPVNVSGTVYNDANGATDNIINGTATNAGGTLYANLTDANNNVVASAAVGTDGTYSFAAIGEGNYSVVLSTFSGSQGATSPAAALPSTYANTAEGTTAAGDGTTNGATAITVANTDLGGINFGISQYPTAKTNIVGSQTNPGGTAQVAVNSSNFSGTDANTGGQIKSFLFTSFPSNVTSITISGTKYTAATFPTAGVSVTASTGALPSNTVSIDPIDGKINSVIPYTTINLAALAALSPATVTIQFTTLLPLRFNEFTVQNMLGKMLINWSTSDEINTSRFDVQKSKDGINWQVLSTLAAKGINGSINNYSVTDDAPFEKINYYRIEEIDKDGAFTWSSIAEANNIIAVADVVKISPNPAVNTTSIELQTDNAGPVKIAITDATGRKITTYSVIVVKGSNKITIADIDKWKSGLYYVIIQNKSNGITGSYKLVKQ